MIKVQFIAISDSNSYSTFATDLEEAIQIFRKHNIHGKCKEIGNDLWSAI